jgi:hypothetical protein
MKLLMFQATRFSFQPYQKMLDDVPDADPIPVAVKDAVVVFIHAEAEDEDRRSKVLTKAAKNVKWLAGKEGWRRAVLHSFDHLGTSKAEPAWADAFIADLAERLRAVGYEVLITPFGYTCIWDLAVRGEAIAKVYKEL